MFELEFQEKLARFRVFLVGADAIGCELLKNFVMMGIDARIGSNNNSKVSGGGKIVITDMDSIEKSNLNRQFLFRSKDIGKMKSVTAANAARAMNPDVAVEPLELKIGKKTTNPSAEIQH